MTDYLTTDSELEAVADAIRAKGATSALLVYPNGFVSAINAIPTGGGANLETGSQTITATESQQSITMTPGAGYDGFDEVDLTVNAIPSNYVGSGVPQRSSADLTASGATVTAPAGYYASAASKSVPSGSASTPATTITANPTISVSSAGLITASVSASQGVTPSVSAGYVSSGTAGTVTVSGSNTQQLTVYNGEHHQPVPSGYTVTISLTNPSGVSHFGQVNIYEATSDDPWQDYGTLLGTITTAAGSTTVSVPSSVYGVYISFDGNWIGYAPQDATVSCTGGVSHTNGDSNVLIFAVTGDGTATIDGVDWEADY